MSGAGTAFLGLAGTAPESMTNEEWAEYKDLVKAVNEEAKTKWEDLGWRREKAAEIRDQIMLGFDSDPIFGSVINLVQKDFEDTHIIRYARGLKAFWLARGGYIEESQLRYREFQMPRDMLGFHVSEEEHKLRLNFAQTSAELVRLGTLRMEAEMNRRLIQLLQAAVPPGSPYYISGAGLSQAGLNSALHAVADSAGADLGAPGVGSVTLLGRETMTGQITDFTGYANETLEEIRLRGRLGVYRGAAVQTVINYVDDDNVPYLPQNELWVLTRTCGEFVTFGEIFFKEASESLNWYWHYVAARDVGGMIYFPWRVRRIVDTSQPALVTTAYPPEF